MEPIKATRVESSSHTDEVLRRIEGVSRVDKVRNEDIWLRQEGILDVVRRRQEEWKDRLEEMNDDRTTKKVFKRKLKGRDLEVDHREDGFTSLNKKTAQYLLTCDFCCCL